MKVCNFCGRSCVSCIEMVLSAFALVRKLHFTVTETFLCCVCTASFSLSSEYSSLAHYLPSLALIPPRYVSVILLYAY